MSTFPIEIFEHIIDNLALNPTSLKSCALVCKLWYPRSRYHLLRRVILLDRTDVVRFAKIIRRGLGNGALADVGGMVEHVVFRGACIQSPGKVPNDTPEDRNLAHLGTFAVMLAHKLPHLSYLGIATASWDPSVLHPDIHRHLSSFASLTWLDLYNMTFPSVADFGRLICALPNLQRLTCWTRCPMFTDRDMDVHFDPRPFLRKASTMQLKNLNLDGNHSPRTIVAFLITSTLATKLERIALGYHERVAVRHAQPLLEAAGSTLRALDITLAVDDMSAPVGNSSGVMVDVPVAENGKYGSFSGSHPPFVLSANTKLTSLIIRSPLPEDPRTFDWLPPLLSTVSTKLQEVMLVIDLRQQNDDTLLDKASAALSSAVCAAIDGLFCSVEEPQPEANRTADPHSEHHEALTQPLRYRFADFKWINLALWVSAAPGVVLPSANQWAARLAPRFPMLCKQNKVFTPVVVAEWRGIE